MSVALGGALLGNLATEKLVDAGLFAGTAYDAHHESVGIVAFLAACALLMLARSLFCADRDSLRRLLSAQHSKTSIAVEFLAGAAGAMGVILMMEGYETHFGGLSPFDPHAVLMHDAPATMVLFVGVFAIARWLIDRFARIAATARLFLGDAFSLISRHASGGAPLRRHRSKPILSPARNVCSRQGELRAPPFAAAVFV